MAIILRINGVILIIIRRNAAYLNGVYLLSLSSAVKKQWLWLNVCNLCGRLTQ